MSEPISLLDLPASAGLRFGSWTLWLLEGQIEDGNDLFFVHPLGWAIRMTVDSAGWVDYRARPRFWRTCYLDRDVHTDSGHEAIFRRLRRQQAASDWPIGVYGIESWRLTVDPERLFILHSRSRVGWPPFVLYRDRPLWTFYKKPLPGCVG